MTGHGSKFERKKEDAIIGLLTHSNLEESARSVGVDPKTLLRWTKESDFDAAYREARRTAFRQSIARLQQASTAAASTILKIMVDPSSPASVKLRAAESALTHAAKAIELGDIDVRVTALERAAEEKK